MPPHPRPLLPEPSLFLYRMPLMFRHLTGSSFSYTDGSQLYLVPVFSWTDVKGVGGDCGPLKKQKRKVAVTKKHAGCSATLSVTSTRLQGTPQKIQLESTENDSK